MQYNVGKINVHEVQRLLAGIPSVKVAYLFGSYARGHAGPNSDIDFAFYLDHDDKKKRQDIRLHLLRHLTRIVGNDAVDVSIINDIASPEMKYFIITEGKVVYEQEPYRVALEPRVLNEYFDFRASLQRYGLTKSV